MRLRIVAIALLTVLLQACAFKGHIESVSGADEIMPTRHINADAIVRIDPELSNLVKKVDNGFVCGAHNYTIILGPAVAESILRTLEPAFRSVTRVETQQERTNAYFLDFKLDGFSPRLKFNPGFWVATPESTTEISIRVKAFRPDGTPVMQTTARGLGNYEDGAGGCDAGMRVVEGATREAVRRAMEDLAQKLINSKALVED
uniref:hypothetical protein n=1 Tax=Castellaniella defragrans TaxID=75697 RepID=UPI00334111DC